MMGQRGRPTKLKEKMQTDITDALATGATIEKVCAYVGIDTQTFYNWMNQGKDAKSGRYFEFFDAVKHAQSHAHVRATGVLASGMLPHDTTAESNESVTETRLRTIRLPDGTVEQQPYAHSKTVYRETVTHHPPDWRAAIEFLKRRDAAYWSATLNINLDPKLVKETIEALESLDQDPAEIFNEIVARAKARAKVKQDADGG